MTTFEVINQDKVSFFSARTSPVFPHFPRQVNHVIFPLISCKRETWKIFSIISMTRSVILVSIFMLRVYVTLSLFLRIWLTEELVSYWTLTLYVTSFSNENKHWNIAACTLLGELMVECRRLVSNVIISIQRRADSLMAENPWNEANFTFTWLSSLQSF